MMKMTSRNDTIFLATMAAIYWHSLPESIWTDCPAIDRTHLPDSMPIIGHFVPGLWFFDVALHDELPALATASEWLCVWWTSIADFSSRLDTIRTYPTRGWGQYSHLYGGDTLFVAMEGYGLGIFDVRDKANPLSISRITGQFTHDLGFLDAILCVARSNCYVFHNLAPWWRGGEIAPIDSFVVPLVFGETHNCLSVSVLKTDSDTFFVLPIYDDGLNFISPADIPGAFARFHFFDKLLS